MKSFIRAIKLFFTTNDSDMVNISFRDKRNGNYDTEHVFFRTSSLVDIRKKKNKLRYLKQEDFDSILDITSMKGPKKNLNGVQLTNIYHFIDAFNDRDSITRIKIFRLIAESISLNPNFPKVCNDDNFSFIAHKNNLKETIRQFASINNHKLFFEDELQIVNDLGLKFKLFCFEKENDDMERVYKWYMDISESKILFLSDNEDYIKMVISHLTEKEDLFLKSNLKDTMVDIRSVERLISNIKLQNID